MPRFQPDFTFLSYRELTPEFLASHGITVLLLDIDNTLAPYEQSEPDEMIVAWLAAMEKAGIKTAFLSNNNGKRVELFNKTLGRPAVFYADKPAVRKGRALMESLGGNGKNTAMMGDQIFTDVWTARRLGATAILVPPILDKQTRFTRFKRVLERGPLRRYHKRHPDAPDVRVGSTLTEEKKKEYRP